MGRRDGGLDGGSTQDGVFFGSVLGGDDAGRIAAACHADADAEALCGACVADASFGGVHYFGADWETEGDVGWSR